ncbi:Hypothetical WD-repeat protein alr2800 [Sorangium cellulosum So ce56]|uniref:Hypothetical WD-repeat protein alr2800 n=1 Tax=Sorangium cellulosum (strain So ce56) TaxID=448385 RepID=A9G0V0_SORC5|nr:Hypothetical WD-repeat protein alr2800 [Sorangium cellulosum So ce56]
MTLPDALAALGARDPEALRLAVVASLAVEIQPALLRRLRRRLVPDATPLSEALLWSSDLALSRTPSALLLRDDALVVLRDRLREDQERLDAARAVIKDAHVGIAEVLRCEEDLVYLGLVDLDRKPRPDLDEAQLQTLIQGRIEQVLRSIAQDAGRRDALLAWSSRALPTLPERVQAHDASATLAAFVFSGGQVAADAWGAVFPPSERDVGIGVRWSTKGIELFVEKGPATVLRLPPIAPLLVDIEAPAGEGWTPVGRAVVPSQGTAKLALAAAVTRLRLRSLRGDGSILRRQGRGGDKAVPVEVAIARLPASVLHLFGREADLAWLDACWNDGVRVASIVGLGGVGKSVLVNRWLAGLMDKGWAGAERVFGWSFFSQGADRLSSSDEFLDAALRWFGDLEPTRGSPWGRGERLAALVGERRSILVLDGIEPLQWASGAQAGKLMDPALEALLNRLAAQSKGMCIVTSGIALTGLRTLGGGKVRERNLHNLSPEAGAALLKAQGVRGTEEELRAAAEEYDGHALALSLLGSYLRETYGGDIRSRDLVPPPMEDPVRRAFAQFKRRFEGKREIVVLYLLGFFERPASLDEIAVLRADPAIVEEIQPNGWSEAVSTLRKAGLVAVEVGGIRDDGDYGARNQGERLDTHPLVRQYFGEQLRLEHADAWREGHRRLYEHLTQKAKPLPETDEEMRPLHEAVVHGCLAGKIEEALDEIYRKRVLRGRDDFSLKRLGLFSSEMAVLAGFFEERWGRPARGLSEPNQAYVLRQAGIALMALGRLVEAEPAMQSALERYVSLEDWTNAAVTAANLSDLLRSGGELRRAVEEAQKSIDFADRSDDAARRAPNRTTYAAVLHALGQRDDATEVFEEAERLQKELSPAFPTLHALWGFRYCDLLLEQGCDEEARARALQSLSWEDAKRRLLNVALDHLTIGRAHLAAIERAQIIAQERHARADFRHVADELDQAVEGLRRAGRLDYLPLGLIARATLHTQTRAIDNAHRDLDEALTIASRGGFRLHQADAHIEHARLAMAEGNRLRAHEHLAKAQSVVEATGYMRRLYELYELDSAIRQQLFDALSALSPAQLERIIGKLDVSFGHPPELEDSQLSRVTELLRWADEHDRFADVERALAHVEFLVIVTLSEEQDVLLRKLPTARRIESDGAEDDVCFAAELPARRGSDTVHRLVVIRVGAIGSAHAVIAVREAIQRWRPENVVVLGIGVGAGEHVGLGDVIVAEKVADVTIIKGGRDDGRDARWNLYRADEELLAAARSFSAGWEDLLTEPRPARGESTRHVGVICSSDAVIASRSFVDACRQLWPDLVGLEMEGAGVTAALHSERHRPKFLMIRGVSDLASGPSGSDDWRAYAADAAAAYTIGLLRHLADHDSLEELASKYEDLRRTHKAGVERTALMNRLFADAKREGIAAGVSADHIASLFAIGRAGSRIVALACCAGMPDRTPLESVSEALRLPLTPFEQWAALLATRDVVLGIAPTRAEPLVRTVLATLDDSANPINDKGDASRRLLATDILKLAATRVGLSGAGAIEALRLWVAAGERPVREERPSVAVFGSSRSAVHHDLCLALGAHLAARGWRLSIGRGANVGHAVVAGFRGRDATGVTIYTASRGEGPETNIRAFPILDEARRAMVESADICIALEGGKGTLRECELAMAAGRPVLAASFTGGSARLVRTQARSSVLSLGLPEAILSLMEGSGPPEEQAERKRPANAMGTAPCGSRRGRRCWARGGVGPRLGAGTDGPERRPGEAASACVAGRGSRCSGRVGIAGARSSARRSRPCVGQQLVQAVALPARLQPADDVCRPGERVDSVHPTRAEDRIADGQALSALIGARE